MGHEKISAPWRMAIGPAVAASLLIGCGDGPAPDRASQTAARVNRAEITVHQINHVLQQQRGLRVEQVDAAGKQVLERLIDQRLAVERAGELKIDRDPKVLMQLEAARDAVLARAYLERVAAAVARPTPEEIRRYFDDHPALFRERRLYDLQELAIEATQDQVSALRARFAATPNTGEFVGWLRTSGFRFSSHQALRAAEQLPPASLNALAALRDGQAHFNPVSDGVQILVRAGSSLQPMTLEQATPAIEQAMLGERRRRLMQRDVEALRAQARIEYVGKFAGPTPAAAEPAASGIGDGMKEPGK